MKDVFWSPDCRNGNSAVGWQKDTYQERGVLTKVSAIKNEEEFRALGIVGCCLEGVWYPRREIPQIRGVLLAESKMHLRSKGTRTYYSGDEILAIWIDCRYLHASLQHKCPLQNRE